MRKILETVVRSYITRFPRFTYAIVYGQGVVGLGRELADLNMSSGSSRGGGGEGATTAEARAQQLMESFNVMFPGIQKWKDHIIQQCRNQG